MLPMHMCICQYFGHHVALAKQIDGKFGRSDKVTPHRKGESVINFTEDQNEMVFEHLDRSLSHAPAVAVGRYKFVSHVVFPNALLEVVGALVV